VQTNKQCKIYHKQTIESAFHQNNQSLTAISLGRYFHHHEKAHKITQVFQ